LGGDKYPNSNPGSFMSGEISPGLGCIESSAQSPFGRLRKEDRIFPCRESNLESSSFYPTQNTHYATQNTYKNIFQTKLPPWQKRKVFQERKCHKPSTDKNRKLLNLVQKLKVHLPNYHVNVILP
jgi:hypothetical protein